MIAMIFEFWMNPGADVARDYSTTSAELRALLADVDGFEGVERFESCQESSKFVALGFFTDESAVTRWRNDTAHRRAQELGRDRFFADYRLRMAEVTRDYGPGRRVEAPDDSKTHHDSHHDTDHERN